MHTPFKCVQWVPSSGTIDYPGKPAGRPSGNGAWKVVVRTPWGNYTSSGWPSDRLAAWQADCVRRYLIQKFMLSGKRVDYNFPERIATFDETKHVGPGLRQFYENLLLKVPCK